MTTDNLCFYLQNRQIQTSQTGGQWYNDTSHPLVFPDIFPSKITPGSETFKTFYVVNVFREPSVFGGFGIFCPHLIMEQP
jgi:hypothetical protein